MLGIVVHSRSAAQRLRLPPNFGGSRHERRVAAIAVKLFDLLAPQHALSRKFRNLLHLAALLHDAGRIYGAEGHEHSGAAMVLTDRSLLLSSPQRRAIAYLVRHHRGPVPSSPKPHDKLRILLAFLRAADALDSRRLHPTTIIIKRTAKKLRITCRMSDDLDEAKRRLGGRGKFELLEQEFGFRIRLRIKKCVPSA